ncbi:MAG: N-acetylmuramoyl-L-alanine amidase [Lachnospiraceae bacterium]|nr:N-acetylmuramoyl-L-alanine amidase [Lachnospiraceae bacterium]
MNEKTIWDHLRNKGLSPAGTAGLMGNLYAESGLNPKNLQNSFERKLDYSDEEYTQQVDGGFYKNFVHDSAGYGLAQWTYYSRKQALLDFAEAARKSIGDLSMQLDFLMYELERNYNVLFRSLKSATSVKAASDAVLLQYERPADQSDAVKTRRAAYGQKYYDEFVGKEETSWTTKSETSTTSGKKPSTNSQETEVKTMSNSSLVVYKKISPNKTSPRNHAIDTITIHCMAGNLTIETCGNVFAPTSRQASSNYGIGSDGRIGMYVEEKDRSWCSSNGVNDHRAVTIEVANDGGANTGWHVSDKAMAALINLVTDICKRNGIKKLVWSDKKDDRVNHRNGCNMTVHRDYANKSCPGDYLYGKHAYIAAEVNKRLGATTTETPAVTPTTGSFLVKVMITDLNIRAGAGTNTAKKGVIKPGTYTIVEVKSGKGSTAGWGKLKSGAGWISLDYAKRV